MCVHCVYWVSENHSRNVTTEGTLARVGLQLVCIDLRIKVFVIRVQAAIVEGRTKMSQS